MTTELVSPVVQGGIALSVIGLLIDKLISVRRSKNGNSNVTKHEFEVAMTGIHVEIAKLRDLNYQLREEVHSSFSPALAEIQLLRYRVEQLEKKI